MISRALVAFGVVFVICTTVEAGPKRKPKRSKPVPQKMKFTDFDTPSDAKDIHIRIEHNTLKKVIVRQVPGGNEFPFKPKQSGNEWHLAWQEAAFADFEFTIEWWAPPEDFLQSGRLKYTTTGQINEVIDWNTAKSFGIMSAPLSQLSDETFEVRGSHALGTSSIEVGPITAVAVTDLSSYYSDNWHQATGAMFALPGGTLAAGAAGQFFAADLPLGDASWILLHTTLDGTDAYFATTIVPEPETALLLITFGFLARATDARRRAA